MKSYQISQLDIKANDYERAGALLGDELGCWNFFEVFPLRAELEARVPLQLCVMKGRGLLNGIHPLKPGTLVTVSEPAVLDFSQATGVCFRYRFTQNVALRERLTDLVQDLKCRGPVESIRGTWKRVDLKGIAGRHLLFCLQEGPLFAHALSSGQSFHCLDLSRICSYTFQGLEPQSEILKQAKQILQLADILPDLRREELFEKRYGNFWYRWVPEQNGKESLDSPGLGPNRDELVDDLLSQLWASPDSACQWMNTAPFHQKRYRVPYLHLPEGWSVSEQLQKRWQTDGVCSGTELGIEVEDILVTITSTSISWTCNRAREHASWSYSRRQDGIDFSLLEVYD